MKKRTLIIGLCLCLAMLAVAEYIPFKVKLNAMERIVVMSLLPKETNFSNWKIINDIKNQLALTEQEAVAINAAPTPEGGVSGNWGAVPEKEITFGEITEKMIVDALKKLDSESKLLPEHLSLYEKFVVRDTK